MKHNPVLLKECLEGLNISPDGFIVDATVGYAGHSSEVLGKLKRGFLFACDQDMEAITYSQNKLSTIGQNFKLYHCNFRDFISKLRDDKIDHVDGFLFDLGVSSVQLDEAQRGFSFMRDADLDMRMNQDQEKSAYEVVNNYSVEDLTKIFYEYGEEKKSKFIAQAIVLERQTKPIKTTLELVEIIKKSVNYKYFLLNHPERQIFQAIRIEVNQELKVIEEVLPQAIEMLRPHGRICVITFHSLEDRIVKNIFRKYSEVNEVFKGLPDIPKEYQPKIKIINKKPIVATPEEISANPRSKSAKLRIIERL